MRPSQANLAAKAKGEAEFRYLAALAGVRVVGEYRGRRVPVACICPSGHECAPCPGNIKSGAGWCRACVGHDPKMAEEKFLARASESSVVVLEPYVNVITKVKCECPRGHICYSLPLSVNKGHGFCKRCSHADFDRVYLVKTDDWAKYGVARGPKRCNDHAFNGWVLHRQWVDLSHDQAYELEKSVKLWRRSLMWPRADSYLIPQGGHSETFPIEYLSVVEEWIETQIP